MGVWCSLPARRSVPSCMLRDRPARSTWVFKVAYPPGATAAPSPGVCGTCYRSNRNAGPHRQKTVHVTTDTLSGRHKGSVEGASEGAFKATLDRAAIREKQAGRWSTRGPRGAWPAGLAPFHTAKLMGFPGIGCCEGGGTVGLFSQFRSTMQLNERYKKQQEYASSCHWQVSTTSRPQIDGAQ